MTRPDRAVVALGVAALLSTVFALSPGGHLPYDFLQLRGAGLVVVTAIGILAVAGGLLRSRIVVLIAGAAFLGAAVVQLLQAGRDTNWLEGNGSTLSLLLGLGVGLLVTGLVPREHNGTRQEG
ncbi:Rv1678 family membrane protein [Qaidamihabitans albus]|uniref:Rv1678 family membrane protein n=1 Tax=Qaidamihabitans albus TaxID=2795733 RepID=UPI0018F23E76|nr:hypothetical protein [Qaidamihabitans albus]